MDKDIYNLELHEYLEINDQWAVRRVPGGWLYIRTGYTDTKIAFVPYSEEFLTPEDKSSEFEPIGGGY